MTARGELTTLYIRMGYLRYGGWVRLSYPVQGVGKGYPNPILARGYRNPILDWGEPRSYPGRETGYPNLILAGGRGRQILSYLG